MEKRRFWLRWDSSPGLSIAGWLIERPGLEYQRSWKRLFFHRKISNSSNLILKLFFTFSKHQILPKTIKYFVPLEWSIYLPPVQLKGWGGLLVWSSKKRWFFGMFFLRKENCIDSLFEWYIWGNCWTIYLKKFLNKLENRGVI